MLSTTVIQYGSSLKNGSRRTISSTAYSRESDAFLFVGIGFQTSPASSLVHQPGLGDRLTMSVRLVSLGIPIGRSFPGLCLWRLL